MLSTRRGSVLAAFLSLLALSGTVRGGDDRPETMSEGKLAPLLSVGSWKSSKPLKLEDLAGKVVMLEFWAVW